MQKLSGEAEQLMDEKAEVLVKYKSLVEDSYAAVKEGHEAMKKKQIEDALTHQPIKNVAGVWAESLKRVFFCCVGACGLLYLHEPVKHLCVACHRVVSFFGTCR